MPIPEADYFHKVKGRLRERRRVLIMDEVQTGLGRTGRLWGIEHYGVSPGYHRHRQRALRGNIPDERHLLQGRTGDSSSSRDPFIHVSTFGGAEVGCPVALAVLEESSSEPAFLHHVQALSEIFDEGFTTLKKKHPEILVGLRQLGLMMGIEMVNELLRPVMSKTCYDNGSCASTPTTIRGSASSCPLSSSRKRRRTRSSTGSTRRWQRQSLCWASQNSTRVPHYLSRDTMAFVNLFPDFMKNPANAIASSSQSRGVKG